MKVLICLAVIFIKVLADKNCGQPKGCVCTVPHSITCLPDTRVFPLFEEKANVTEINLRHTQIVGLPPFQEEKWISLKYVDVRSTPMLSCEAISRIRRPGLTILSDCNSTTDDNATTTLNGINTMTTAPATPGWLLPLLMVMMGVVSFFSGIRTFMPRARLFSTRPVDLENGRVVPPIGL